MNSTQPEAQPLTGNPQGPQRLNSLARLAKTVSIYALIAIVAFFFGIWLSPQVHENHVQSPSVLRTPEDDPNRVLSRHRRMPATAVHFKNIMDLKIPLPTLYGEYVFGLSKGDLPAGYKPVQDAKETQRLAALYLVRHMRKAEKRVSLVISVDGQMTLTAPGNTYFYFPIDKTKEGYTIYELSDRGYIVHKHAEQEWTYVHKKTENEQEYEAKIRTLEDMIGSRLHLLKVDAEYCASFGNDDYILELNYVFAAIMGRGAFINNRAEVEEMKPSIMQFLREIKSLDGRHLEMRTRMLETLGSRDRYNLFRDHPVSVQGMDVILKEICESRWLEDASVTAEATYEGTTKTYRTVSALEQREFLRRRTRIIVIILMDASNQWSVVVEDREEQRTKLYLSPSVGSEPIKEYVNKICKELRRPGEHSWAEEYIEELSGPYAQSNALFKVFQLLTKELNLAWPVLKREYIMNIALGLSEDQPTRLFQERMIVDKFEGPLSTEISTESLEGFPHRWTRELLRVAMVEMITSMQKGADVSLLSPEAFGTSGEATCLEAGDCHDFLHFTKNDGTPHPAMIIIVQVEDAWQYHFTSIKDKVHFKIGREGDDDQSVEAVWSTLYTGVRFEDLRRIPQIVTAQYDCAAYALYHAFREQTGSANLYEDFVSSVREEHLLKDLRDAVNEWIRNVFPFEVEYAEGYYSPRIASMEYYRRSHEVLFERIPEEAKRVAGRKRRSGGDTSTYRTIREIIKKHGLELTAEDLLSLRLGEKATTNAVLESIAIPVIAKKGKAHFTLIRPSFFTSGDINKKGERNALGRKVVKEKAAISLEEKVKRLVWDNILIPYMEGDTWKLAYVAFKDKKLSVYFMGGTSPTDDMKTKIMTFAKNLFGSTPEEKTCDGWPQGYEYQMSRIIFAAAEVIHYATQLTVANDMQQVSKICEHNYGKMELDRVGLRISQGAEQRYPESYGQIVELHQRSIFSKKLEDTARASLAEQADRKMYNRERVTRVFAFGPFGGQKIDIVKEECVGNVVELLLKKTGIYGLYDRPSGERCHDYKTVHLRYYRDKWQLTIGDDKTDLLEDDNKCKGDRLKCLIWVVIKISDGAKFNAEMLNDVPEDDTLEDAVFRVDMRWAILQARYKAHQQFYCKTAKDDGIQWLLTMKKANHHIYVSFENGKWGETKFRTVAEERLQSKISALDRTFAACETETNYGGVSCEAMNDQSRVPKGVVFMESVFDDRRTFGAIVAHSLPGLDEACLEKSYEECRKKISHALQQHALCLSVDSTTLNAHRTFMQAVKGIYTTPTYLHVTPDMAELVQFLKDSAPATAASEPIKFDAAKSLEQLKIDYPNIFEQNFKIGNEDLIAIYQTPQATDNFMESKMNAWTGIDLCEYVAERMGVPVMCFSYPSGGVPKISNYSASTAVMNMGDLVNPFLLPQKVENEELKFEEDVKSGRDHSKFAIPLPMNGQHWVCVSDLNRHGEQTERGGSMICLQDAELSQSLRCHALPGDVYEKKLETRTINGELRPKWVLVKKKLTDSEIKEWYPDCDESDIEAVVKHLNGKHGV
ncbi:hypothetical protein QR680_006436 [Steinernema hermaphroditum]|uniref:Uncharacterized protein n=1 Tax=Steinernema hermaphroditum TaxID=289476 RepID=A0AA39LX48_9BILA|nr:hypothetical protein QR680_006436 [Steinernema hermaphroditum]